MAHGFSAASLKAMEDLFDSNVLKLRAKLDWYATTGREFDLKELIAYYAYDVLGDLAFGNNFGSQEGSNPEHLPPINDHIFLACLYGSLPSLLPCSMKLSAWLPFKWMQGLLQSRRKLRDTTAETVSRAIEEHNQGKSRHNLLTQLIEAKDPETGAKLDEIDINTEAFAYL